MTKTITTRHDIAEHLRTPKWLLILKLALRTQMRDAAFIAKALGDIEPARAKGMSYEACDAGLVFRMAQVKYTTGIIT
ncbi:MAG: hypothetical protein LWX52_03880 [Deltaproteobacteria bacterium]|nr:hypothetical protein [Deltaproteobacteria bacterium]